MQIVKPWLLLPAANMCCHRAMTVDAVQAENVVLA